MSGLFDNVYFFVVNVDDDGDTDDLLELNGVPSIIFVNIAKNRRKIMILEDPEAPDDATWYHPMQIKNFIEECMR